MIQCKCGYVKAWCPFHGNTLKIKGREEIRLNTIATIDQEIAELLKRKDKLNKPTKLT